MYTKTRDLLMSSQVGRNAPCPCGSGKKYKNCCQKSGFALNKKQQNKIVVGTLAAVALIAAAVVFSKNSSTPVPRQQFAPSSQQSATSQPGQGVPTGTAYTPQPPGPAPEGKVWSPEHGHWHDAPAPGTPQTNTANVTPNSASQQLTPQPPGPAPEGKVWSAEHGHWHDAPATATTTTQTPSNGMFDITPEQINQPAQSSRLPGPIPQPEGPAPEGKVWSPEHGHWHDAPAEVKVVDVKKETAEQDTKSDQSDPE
jgi:hypothetical protein